MSTPFERMEELLLLRLSSGLSVSEQAELDALLAEHELPPELRDLDQAVAALDLASLPPGDDLEDLPASLHAEVLSTGQEMVERSTGSQVASFEPRSTARSGWATWLAAAAAAAFAVLWWQGRAPIELPVPAPAELRAQLLESDAEALRWDWSGTDDPAVAEAGGDVTWSADRQEGYLRISGLAVNDPGVEQYQLWIFDAERDDRHPVDGGVFDVTSSGEVVIPIDPRLRVSEAALFAVTVEKPGGVVVSTR
ncbi:MAG: anti-sigma factor, partial [Acidobacteriota bacterium]